LNFCVPFKTPVCYFLCYFDRMKHTGTYRDKKKLRAGRTTTREAVKYQKVHDGRKRRIRGLWNRGGVFYAQLSLPNEDGVQKMRRVKLNATTVASATDELRRMVIDRDDDQLPAMVRKPRFDNYAQDYIDREYALGRKTDRTLNTESGHINFWRKQFGETRLNKITPKMIQEGLIRRKATGVSPHQQRQPHRLICDCQIITAPSASVCTHSCSIYFKKEERHPGRLRSLVIRDTNLP